MIGDKLIGTISKGENILFVVKRHPIGLIPIYLFVVVGFITCLVAMVLFTNSQDILGLRLNDGIWITLFVIVVIFVLFCGFIARSIYWANELVVTNENLIQILRPTFFSRHVARLSLGKVQDVSVQQSGFFEMTFRYGTLVIETSGEVASYRFTYTPEPNEIAAKIMAAHDEFIDFHSEAQDKIGP